MMKYALLVFAGTWLSVFTLGLQSLNVNQGHYWAAAITSLGIGTGHIILYKYMPGANAVEIAFYLLAGVTGITSSMWFHRRAKIWLAAKWPALRERARLTIERLEAYLDPAAMMADSIGPREDEHRDVGYCGAMPCRICMRTPHACECPRPRLTSDVH